MAQTKREWLVDQGLATAGRGRFSAAAKEALAKAEADGLTFSDSAKEVKGGDEAVPTP
jgi:hypothetical protein